VRRCVGAAFAVAELAIVLGSLLAPHRFGLAEDTPVTPVPRTFTIGPQGGVRMIYHGPAAGETGGPSSGVNSIGEKSPAVVMPRLHHACPQAMRTAWWLAQRSLLHGCREALRQADSGPQRPHAGSWRDNHLEAQDHRLGSRALPR
jgi:hypothetical protein